jgi:uncharacterized protein (TIGR00299 family) protein
LKIAYFDCFSGVSGNMILGALVDLGLDLEQLRTELRKLALSGFGIEAGKVTKRGIRATYVNVVTDHPDQARTLEDIIGLIEMSRLDDAVKETGKQIFARLAEAEARVHDRSVEAVHLHEVGATDTLVDVFGSLIGLRALGIEEVRCSPLNLGSGLARCSHGWLPVPAPITAELLRGVPAYTAAIATGVAAGFGDMPLMKVVGVGYGAGKMDPEIPNFLRVFTGERIHAADDFATESVMVLETNIDDMNPQFYDHIMESLLQAGALDVFLTPVQMKKNRPGVLLTVISRSEDAKDLIGVLTRESTTLGVRITETRRVSLPRSAGVVNTRFGEIRIKVARRGDGSSTVTPEYDDCKKAARAHNVPLSMVYSEVQRAWGDSGAAGRER